MSETKRKVITRTIKIEATLISRPNFRLPMISNFLLKVKVCEKLRIKKAKTMNCPIKLIFKEFPLLYGRIPLVERVEKAKQSEVNARFPVRRSKKNKTAVIIKYIGNSFLPYINNLSSEF